MKKTLCVLLALALLGIAGLSLAEEKVYQIGIAQFAVHGSLDNCREGFLLGLQENSFEEGKNIRVDYQNAQADMGLAAGIASKFVDNGYDLILAIATPMAVVSHNTSDGKIPVVYSAVSTPVQAGLAGEDGLSDGPTTGTSDLLPIEEQLKLIRAIQPEAKTIGILYTLSETNAVYQAGEYQRMAGEYGFTVEVAAVAAGNDIALALPGLLDKVDLVTMVLDNTVVQYLDTVLDAADAKGIPVYGSEVEQVQRGCVAAEGLDYIELGRQTGAMAARVLNGEDAGAIPFELLKESSLYYNPDALAALNLSLPQELMDTGTDVTK